MPYEEKRDFLRELTADISELIINRDERLVLETYIFEPSPAEKKLGRMLAVAETEERGGIGSELLDITVSAMQREYYREPVRGLLASFESALHQANLVLHDTAESGVRDWMGHFHVAVGVLAGATVHVSTAGDGVVLLARRGRLTLVSEGLSYSPFTDPLRTFAQVASGTVTSRDVLFLGSAAFTELYRLEDMARFTIDHSASTIAMRLQQLYDDRRSQEPVAALVVSMLPQHIAAPAVAPGVTRRPRPLPALTLRKPIIVERSWLKNWLVAAGRGTAWLLKRWLLYGWPLIVRGSRRGGRVLLNASYATSLRVQHLTAQQLARWRAARASQPMRQAPGDSRVLPFTDASLPGSAQRSALRAPEPGRRWTPHLTGRVVEAKQYLGTWSPRALMARTVQAARRLPPSSLLLAGAALVLAVALVVSVVLLHRKRVEDAAITRASEILEQARRTVESAENSLIYDNREQARVLASEASDLATNLEATGLYQDEQLKLRQRVSTVNDRLQRVLRLSGQDMTVVGDFATALPDVRPAVLAYAGEALYTLHPKTNAVVRMLVTGDVQVVSESSQGVGFVEQATAHLADKTIVLTTDQPGIALFDTKTDTLEAQTIPWSSDKPAPLSAAAYGSRLYIYDRAASNIIMFTKTLKGYTGGGPWIQDTDFPRDTITSLGIDGNIYTLHTDGLVRKLFKGAQVAFDAEPVEPALTGATKLLVDEEWRHLYVVDLPHRRVVVYSPEGALVNQTLLAGEEPITDVTIDAKEQTLYALVGTQVLAIGLQPND